MRLELTPYTFLLSTNLPELGIFQCLQFWTPVLSRLEHRLGKSGTPAPTFVQGLSWPPGLLGRFDSITFLLTFQCQLPTSTAVHTLGVRVFATVKPRSAADLPVSAVLPPALTWLDIEVDRWQP